MQKHHLLAFISQEELSMIQNQNSNSISQLSLKDENVNRKHRQEKPIGLADVLKAKTSDGTQPHVYLNSNR
jgi:hypothetical protein